MIGTLIGDTVGSVFEFDNIKTKEFELINEDSEPTDDSILTFAVLDCLMNNITDEKEIALMYKKWTKAYPYRGYGCMFYNWVMSDSIEPYNSYGNGSAMRTSPIGWFAKSEEEVIELATKFSSITHNHPEGIKGAIVVSMCIYYARIGKSKEFIRDYIYSEYPRTKELNYDNLVKYYSFDVTCEGSVPEALYCFLISESFIDCLRTTISIGGDSDTLAAISCSVAEAYYRYIDKDLIEQVFARTPSANDGCLTFELLSEFMEMKILDGVTFEEINDDSNILISVGDDKTVLLHSRNIYSLREYIIYYELKDAIKEKYKDIEIESIDNYDLDTLINELKDSGMEKIVNLIVKLDHCFSFKDLEEVLREYNEIFSKINELTLYNSPKEALTYFKDNDSEYYNLLESKIKK